MKKQTWKREPVNRLLSFLNSSFIISKTPTRPHCVGERLLSREIPKEKKGTVKKNQITFQNKNYCPHCAPLRGGAFAEPGNSQGKKGDSQKKPNHFSK